MSEHVRLGGSKIHRVMACPASARLEELAGPDEAGPHAVEGTVAHHIGETCLRTGGRDKALETFNGLTIEGVKVTREMLDAIKVYVDWAENIQETSPTAKILLEHQVSMAALNPPEPMRGSADFIAVIKDLRLLIVGDYKHGRGHVVEVKGNKQTRYYALAALLTLPPEDVAGIDRVQMTIIQPRAYHDDGPIRSETIGVEELLDFADDVLKAADLAQSPNAPAVPGEHCLFCRASSTCLAKGNQAVAVAQQEFTSQALPSVDTLPLATVAEMLAGVEPKLELVESWVKSARKLLQEKLEAGESVPGFKLVAKRATRVWSDPEKVKAWALLDAGLSESDIYNAPELLSPAQVEKLVGKKNMPKELTASVSSGYTLASESSSKPAAKLAAADEFSTVEL